MAAYSRKARGALHQNWVFNIVARLQLDVNHVKVRLSVKHISYEK